MTGNGARSSSSSGRGPLSLSRQRPATRTANVGASSFPGQDTNGSDINKTSSSNSKTSSKIGNPAPSSNGSKSVSDNGNPPPPKKRKTEEFVETSNGEDIWDEGDDDDFEFTQADLEKIDVMASQAIASKEGSSSSEHATSSKTPAVSDPGTVRRNIVTPQSSSHSVTMVTPKTSTSTFLKPKVLISANSSSSSAGGSTESSHIDSFSAGSSRRSSSEAGTSGYPSSLSHPSSRNSSLKSSSSIRSGSSEEIMPAQVKRQGSNPTQNSSESSVELSVGALLRSPQSEALKEELDRYKKECGQLKLKMEKVQFEKEGEIKILRDNLQRKEGELSSMKHEKITAIDQKNRAQSEKERQLQSDVDKLNTQLQFKDRDLSNMKEKLQALESRSLMPDSQQPSPARSPVVVSPKRRKVMKEDKSPTPKTGFPTQQSFMAGDRSPIIPVGGPSTSRSSNVEKITKDAATMVHLKDDTASPLQSRQHGLKINMHNGHLSGASLVANLIEAVPEILDTNSERGIVGLLQRRTAAMDLIPFQFDRDNSNLMLSPIPNKRLNELKHNVSTESTELVPLVSQDNYSLALEGLSCLLREHRPVQHLSKADSNILPEIESFVDTALSPDSNSSSSQTFLSNHSGAIYFLPLLNDYLSHYIDMLNTSVDGAKSPSTPKSSSSSKGSSDIESVTSSFELLLKNSASYANNLENLTIVVLRILHKLVSHCGAVRDILLSTDREGESDESVSDIERIPQQETTGMETDNSSSSTQLSSSVSGSLSIVRPVIDLHLLSKVFKLANPGHSGRKYNAHVMEKALDILNVLANHVNETHIERLLPAVTDGIIINGLECESNVAIVLQNVELLCSLVRHRKIVNSLCVSSERSEQEGCILYTLYTVCINSVDKMSNENFIELTRKIVECLLNIQSVHDLGISALTNEECDCSLEIVKCIVLSLHRILQIYEQTNDISLMETQKRGLLLLHMLWQKDESLVEYHPQVEYQYIRLVCGLARVFKYQLQGDFESEMNILHDLWDFNQEDSELSQDSEDPDTH